MLLATGLLVGGTLCQSAQAYDPAWNRMRGLPVREVHVLSHEVFDPTNPAENRRVFRWANALHIQTRRSVIERELLMRRGDGFQPLLAEETERNLKALGIFQDVLVSVERRGDSVDVVVRTDDRWSTKVITDLSNEGDIFKFRLGMENTNFLGRATKFGGSVLTSNDVDAFDFGFREPRVLGSRWDFRYRYAENDLSTFNQVRLIRPFFSEFIRWSADTEYKRRQGEWRVFDNESVVDTLDLNTREFEAFVALHSSADQRSRTGLLFSHRKISRDVTTEQSTVALVWSLMQRDFKRLHHIDLFGVSEDVASGRTLQLGVGIDSKVLSAEHNRFFWRFDSGWGHFFTPHLFTAWQFRHHGFVRDGRLENSRSFGETFGFYQTHRQTLAWTLGFAAMEREPRHLQFALGGNSRLRGFDARHQTGTRIVWANLEERIFSDWNFYFLRFGVAVFVDVGQAWDSGESLRLKQMDAGAGVGLRIGNNKSRNGLLRLDVAMGGGTLGVEVSGGSFFRVGRSLGFLHQGLFR